MDRLSTALLEEARDLLAHVNPSRDFVEVQRRALELLVAQLRKRNHAARASAEPEGAETSSEKGRDHNRDPQVASAVVIDPSRAQRTRRPAAAVVQAVWQRDQGRCAYVDERGQRCRETSMLEYHHERAWALGGATSVDNIALRCKAHNALAAERDFGRDIMASKRHCHAETAASE